jgi:hypothetical protein
MYKSIYTIFKYLFYYDYWMSLMLNAYVCTMQKLYRELKALNKFLLFFSNVRNSRRESTFTSVGRWIWMARENGWVGNVTVYVWQWHSHGPNIYKDTKPMSFYWCLIEFINWRYSQSCWYFRPLLWTSAILTFSLVHHPPPLPCVNKDGVCIYTVYNRGWEDRVVWRTSIVIHCVFDQFPNLQNCFTIPNKTLAGEGTQTEKHLPPSPFTFKFLRKADI